MQHPDPQIIYVANDLGIDVDEGYYHNRINSERDLPAELERTWFYEFLADQKKKLAWALGIDMEKFVRRLAEPKGQNSCS